MNYVLGIDIGTSGCKCVLLNTKGDVVSTQSAEYSPDMRADGTSEQDPDDWFRAAVRCIEEMRNTDGIDIGSVSAVSVTGQMQGITLIGKDGLSVRKSMLWNDMRPESEANELKKRHGPLFMGTARLLPTPSLTVSKILWLKKHEPEAWERTEKFLLAPNYIAYRLTGRMIADRNNIVLTGLNDVDGNGWSERLIQVCGVERGKVPDLVGCFDVVGTLKADPARQTGLKTGVPVVAGGGDGSVESYAIGIAGTTRLKVRLGSASAIDMIVKKESLGKRSKSPGLPDVTDDHLMVAQYTSACASSIKWVREVFYGEQPRTGQTYVLMDNEASGVPLGSDGLLYHPYLFGESAPYYDPSLRARFTGINGGMRRGHFVRSAYEGVSFSIRDVIEKSPQFREATDVILVGGGTKSTLWTSILADVLGRDALVPANGDAAYGAAIMAGAGIGLWDGLEVARRNVEKSPVARHVAEHTSRYNERFARYLALAGQ